jgi:tRNA 2-thiouridine synthesizing protein A
LNDVLDARGLRCPLPVLKLEKRLETLSPGETLLLRATDPIAKIDVPLYCTQHRHDCTVATKDGELRFTIVRR